MIEASEVEGLIITIDDVRKAGHCARGAKRWCDNNGIDFRDFLKNGIAAGRLLEKQDGHAEQLIRRTLERRNG